MDCAMPAASAPHSSRCCAQPKVAALVLAKVKDPVSVSTAAYKQPAIAGEIGRPEAMARA